MSVMSPSYFGPAHRDHYLQGNRRDNRTATTIAPDHTCYINMAVKEQSMNSVAPRFVTSFNTPSPLLRRALLADAALCAVAGIALVLAADILVCVWFASGWRRYAAVVHPAIA